MAFASSISLIILLTLGSVFRAYDRYYVINFIEGCTYAAVVGVFLKRSVQIRFTWFLVSGIGWVASDIVSECIFAWLGYYLEQAFFISGISTGLILGLMQYIVMRGHVPLYKWTFITMIAHIITHMMQYYLFGGLILWASW